MTQEKKSKDKATPSTLKRVVKKAKAVKKLVGAKVKKSSKVSSAFTTAKKFISDEVLETAKIYVEATKDRPESNTPAKKGKKTSTLSKVVSVAKSLVTPELIETAQEFLDPDRAKKSGETPAKKSPAANPKRDLAASESPDEVADDEAEIDSVTDETETQDSESKTKAEAEPSRTKKVGKSISSVLDVAHMTWRLLRDTGCVEFSTVAKNPTTGELEHAITHKVKLSPSDQKHLEKGGQIVMAHLCGWQPHIRI